MSKVTVALGSFIVGACCMFFVLSGIHTSILAHPVLAQTAISAGPSAVPVVPPVAVETSGNTIEGMVFDLDGVNSTGDVFDNATIEYGGGAFRLIQPKFSGSIRLRLKGAAANTLALLQYIQAVEAGQRPKRTIPRQPLQRAAQITNAMTADLISPYGQK